MEALDTLRSRLELGKSEALYELLDDTFDSGYVDKGQLGSPEFRIALNRGYIGESSTEPLIILGNIGSKDPIAKAILTVHYKLATGKPQDVSDAELDNAIKLLKERTDKKFVKQFTPTVLYKDRIGRVEEFEKVVDMVHREGVLGKTNWSYPLGRDAGFILDYLGDEK